METINFDRLTSKKKKKLRIFRKMSRPKFPFKTLFYMCNEINELPPLLSYMLIIIGYPE